MRKKKKFEPVFGITEEWKFAREITDHPRTLKASVRQYNDLFGSDKNHQTFIISGSKGYKQTNDKQLILDYLEREERIMRIKRKQTSRRRKRVQDFFSQNERLPL